MQIISGTARGIFLEVPKGDTVRPTSARARKALFDSLGPWEGLRVADFFAGSGALGLEAASRGAAEVVFVEEQIRHMAVIEKNIAKGVKTGIESRFFPIRYNVFSLTTLPLVPDIILADPPYDRSAGFLPKLLEMPLLESMPEGTRCVWEIPDSAPELKAFTGIGTWETEALRNYGSVWFLILKRRKD